MQQQLNQVARVAIYRQLGGDENLPEFGSS